MIFERTTTIHAPLPEVFAFFSDPKNLAKITPPRMGFQIVESPDRPLVEGDRIRYTLRVFGFPIKWTTRIIASRENGSFADLQEKGPYKLWLHTHTFRDTEHGVVMHDHVQYELPMGFLGRLFGGWLVRRELESIFDYRSQVIGKVFG